MKYKMIAIRVSFYGLFIIFNSHPLFGQWQNSGNIVQLNNSNRDKSVIVSDMDEGLPLGKFAVIGNPDDYLNDVLMYVRANQFSTTGSTLMRLKAKAFHMGNPTVLEGLTDSNLSLFKFEYNGNANLRGKLNVQKSGTTGRILEANGNESIWFDGSQYSWGFGGTWNRFADPVTIGSGTVPSLGVALRIDGSKDINMVGGDIGLSGNGDIDMEDGNITIDGTGDLYFKDNGLKSIIFRDATDALTLSEITSGLNFLRIEDRNLLLLNANDMDIIRIDGLNQRVEVSKDIVMDKTAQIQWGDIPGTPKALIVYESSDIGMVNTTLDKNVQLLSNEGSIIINDGIDKTVFVDGNLGIGLSDPQHKLHVQGDVGITGEFYALSDRRLKSDIKKIEKVLPMILQLSPVTYQWRNKPVDQKISIGLIAQEVEKLFPQAVKTDKEGMKMVNYHVFSVLSIQAIKEQQEMIDKLNKRLTAIEKAIE